MLSKPNILNNIKKISHNFHSFYNFTKKQSTFAFTRSNVRHFNYNYNHSNFYNKFYNKFYENNVLTYFSKKYNHYGKNNSILSKMSYFLSSLFAPLVFLSPKNDIEQTKNLLAEELSIYLCKSTSQELLSEQSPEIKEVFTLITDKKTVNQDTISDIKDRLAKTESEPLAFREQISQSLNKMSEEQVSSLYLEFYQRDIKAQVLHAVNQKVNHPPHVRKKLDEQLENERKCFYRFQPKL